MNPRPNEEPEPITPQLLDKISCGDEDAADDLVRLLYPLVWRIVRRHLRRTADHEDVVQEIFMKLFLKLDQYQGIQPFGHWASRICVTTCCDWLRKKQARPLSSFADFTNEEVRVIEASLQGTAPEQHAVHQDVLSGVLDKLIDRLNPDEQIAIRLLDLEETSIKDACALTGWSESKTKTTAMRARRKLRDELAMIERRSAGGPLQPATGNLP